MEIVKIYEPASTDGYKHFGDGIYFLDESVATSSSKNRHGAYSVDPICHNGVKVGDDQYLLVTSKTPISLANSEAAKAEARKIAIAKLSSEECELLGISTDK